MKLSHSYIVAMTLLISGCHKTEISWKQQNPLIQKGETEVIISIDPDISVKAPDITEYYKDIHIFVFDTNGHKIFHSYNTQLNGYTARANYGINHFAAIINAGESPQFDIDSLEQLYNLIQEKKYGTEDNLTFSGLSTCFISPLYKNAIIGTTRTMAKLTFVFDKNNLDPEVNVEITRIQLKNIPATTYLFKENRPTSVTQFKRYGPYIVYNNLEPENHENATPLFMHENMQGDIGSNSDPNTKHPGEKAPLCSFVSIIADYNSPQKCGEVEYIHYPGNNNTNNFDIVRNHHYKETIIFNGDALGEEVRTDSSSLQIKKYLITLSANPPEGGTVTGGGSYEYGIQPLIYASPYSDYLFTGWDPPVTPVTTNCHYTANFEIIPTPPDTTFITSIILTAPDSIINGETTTATIDIQPQDATEKTVTWHSSDTCYATVDYNGTIETHSPGTTLITVSSTDGSGVSAYKTITIYNQPDPEIPVTGISLDNTTLNMIKGEMSLLTATITPSDATHQEIIWQSSAPEIVSVNTSGQIEAIASGSAIITATTAGETHYAQCIVNVFKNIHLEPKTHIVNQYDQPSNEVIQSDIIIYLRGQIPKPSDMNIINAIESGISVDVTYTYTIDNNTISGFGTLTLDTIDNNDYPHIRLGGNTILITISGPMNESQLLETQNTLTITPLHGNMYIGEWYVTW